VHVHFALAIQTGKTPLMIASENGSKHVVKKLLEHGALVDQKCNVSCKTAICCAYSMTCGGWLQYFIFYCSVMVQHLQWPALMGIVRWWRSWSNLVPLSTILQK